MEGEKHKFITVKDLIELRKNNKVEYDKFLSSYQYLKDFSQELEIDPIIFKEEDKKTKDSNFAIDIDLAECKKYMLTDLSNVLFKNKDKNKGVSPRCIKFKTLEYKKKIKSKIYEGLLTETSKSIKNRRYVYKYSSDPSGDYKFIEERINQTLITYISYIPFHIFLNMGENEGNPGYRTYSMAEYTYILDTIYKPNYLLSKGQKVEGFYSSLKELYEENSDITKGKTTMDASKGKAIIDSDLSHSLRELLFTVKFVDEGHKDLKKKPLVYMNRKSIGFEDKKT